MKEEMIDEVDPSGKVVSVRPRSDLRKGMFMHNASLVIPITSDGRFLLSRRAADKHPYPDTWCCGVGGKASSGESPERAAEREMVEEVGRSYPIRKIASFVYDTPEYKAIFTVFTTNVPVSAEELALDPREIQYSKAFRLDEILELIKDDPSKFAPTFITAIQEFSRHYSPA